MHLDGISVFEQQDETVRSRRDQAGRGQAGKRLRAVAAVMLTMVAGVPSGFAQQTAPTATDKAASDLPAAPAPVLTAPFPLRPSLRDFSQPSGRLLGNPINEYRATSVAKANFAKNVS